MKQEEERSEGEVDKLDRGGGKKKKQDVKSCAFY